MFVGSLAQPIVDQRNSMKLLAGCDSTSNGQKPCSVGSQPVDKDGHIAKLLLVFFLKVRVDEIDSRLHR